MSILYGVIFGVISLIGYGICDYYNPIASRRIGILESNLLLRTVTTLLLLILAPLFVNSIPPFSTGLLLIVIAASIFSSLGMLTYSKSTIDANISINVSIANSWSIVTIALLLIFLGTHVSQSSAIYIAVIILGTMLVSMELKELRHLNFTKVSKGAPYAFLAMLSWGAAFFFGIILIEDIGWFLASLYLSIGMTTVYIIAYSRTKPKYIDPKPAWAVILLYAVSVTAGSLAFGIGVLNNPLIVTPIAAASPAVTIFMAVAKLKEKLEPNHILGIFMIILGLVALSL